LQISGNATNVPKIAAKKSAVPQSVEVFSLVFKRKNDVFVKLKKKKKKKQGVVQFDESIKDAINTVRKSGASGSWVLIGYEGQSSKCDNFIFFTFSSPD